MKAKLFVLLLIFNLQFSIFNCFAQAGEWVWIKGDSIPNQPGNFGVQGVPSPTNNPPSLYEPCEWTDLNGNFWLFGGGNIFQNHGDLWKYDAVTNEWTWMKGSGILNFIGNYGIQGISSPANLPPSRIFASASWVDNQGNLWMFGGYSDSIGTLSDLWKYNISINEWTWMKGTMGGSTGVFGIQGIPDPANHPGSKSECPTAWKDSTGDLWLFGGTEFPFYDDLWKYNIASNQWTWMKGSTTYSQPIVYGSKGVEAPSNTPGQRIAHARWTDNTGKFWLFGGYADYILNDLWRYNPATNNWTWISGDSTSVLNPIGIYGTKCVVSSNNLPGIRFENRAAWKDQHGNFLFFGGGYGGNFTYTWNDLWVYCLSANKWVWVSGDSVSAAPGHWGSIGVASPLNIPSARGGSVGWKDSSGHLYLFGGAASNFTGKYNDLWKYTIDTTCGVCPAPNSIEEENSNSVSTIEVFPNPSSESFTIRSADYAIDKIEIFNLLGEEVYEKQLSAAECQLSTRRFGNGIYIVKIYTHDRIYQKKLMVNH